MKNLLFLIFVFIIAVKVSYSQECFVVLKIKGEIVLENTGASLAKGDKVCSSDKVIFKSKDAVAILYNSDKARYTIKPNKKTEQEISGVFKSIVANVLSQSTTSTSTRPFNVDLKKSFTDPFYVIDSIRVFTNEEDYPIDEKSYFSVSYSYNQKEYFVKLNGTKSSIIFDKESIFMVNGNYIDQNAIDKITLFYNNVSKSKIKSFSLKFIDGVELKNELLPFIAELQNQGKNDKEVSEELLLYMNDVYGEFDAGYLYSWFDLVLNLKI